MVKKLKEARENNDFTLIRELLALIEEYRKSCGSPYSDEEIRAMTNTKLDETDLNFLHNAQINILRSIEIGDLEGTEKILKGVQSYTKPKITRMPEGFIAMLETVTERSADNEEPVFHAKATVHQQQPAIGFRAILNEAVSRSPDREEEEPVTRFRDGFIQMLESASTGGEIRSVGTNEEVHQPQCGFKAMAESAFGETTTVKRKPIRRVPLGFREMLNDFNRGNEELQPINRSFLDQPQQYGMAAMARAAFSYENPTTKREPILRSLQKQIHTILKER